MAKESDDLSKLAQTIFEKIVGGEKKSMPSPYMLRVPEELRKVKESAYTPQLVSIGPLHRNKEHLKSPMEDIKKHYAEALFKRVLIANKTTDIKLVLQKCVEKMIKAYAEKVEVDALEDVEKMKETLDKAKKCKWFAEKVDAKDVEKMKELLDRTKKCFAEKVDDLVVTKFVIDGCFILELLYRYHHTYKPPKPDDEPPYHCHDGCIPFFLHKNPHHTDMIKTNSNPNSKPHEEPHHTDMIGTSNRPNSNNKTSQDFCFDSALSRVAIKHDLSLLENQLPFFVLEDMFDLTVATIPNHLLVLVTISSHTLAT
ncbi:unnamed protein product [Camellia sinensis]